MRLLVSLMLLLAIAAPARAEVQFFFLHHADTPVPVPGGTSSFFVDATSQDTETPRLVEQQVIAPGETATFPSFTSTPFAADGTLLPIASVALLVGANQKMRSCGTVAADLYKVDAGGVLTPNGGAVRTDATIPNGNASEVLEGTRIEFAVTDRSVLAGEGFALTSSLTNDCSIRRRTFFETAGSVRFQCCFTTAAKCAARKMLTASKFTSCHLKRLIIESATGKPVRPDAITKCNESLAAVFAKFEGRGGCPTAGDAPEITALIAALRDDLDATLDPLGPNRKNKCQARKLRKADTFLQCLLKLEAKAAQKGQPLSPDPLIVAKCRARLAADFAFAESFNRDCDTTGDVAAIDPKVAAFTTDVSSRLACPCP